MSDVRLVLSCGCERIIDAAVLDAYGIEDGDTGWCHEHPDTAVEAMFVERAISRVSERST